MRFEEKEKENPETFFSPLLLFVYFVCVFSCRLKFVEDSIRMVGLFER